MTTALIQACDDYLDARTGCYDWRRERYDAAAQIMAAHGQLADEDLLLDVGAGGTELDIYLRTELGWRGRYWPVDGWMGVDLAYFWTPGRQVAWSVALEVIEHMPPAPAGQLLEALKRSSTKGVVLSTPNGDVVDVLGMDATHQWAVPAPWLVCHGFTVTTASLYGQPEDSLLAWWTRPSSLRFSPVPADQEA